MRKMRAKVILVYPWGQLADTEVVRSRYQTLRNQVTEQVATLKLRI
jgi:hypothetical protein